MRRQFFGEQLTQIARFNLSVARDHHRGVGRKVTMRRIARRLDVQFRKVKMGGYRTCPRQLFN